MEGLDEMKDSEKIGGRFVQREYVTPEAQEVIDRLKAEKKQRKLEFKAKLKADQEARAKRNQDKVLEPA